MHEGDMPAISRVLHHAFAGTREVVAAWVRESGLEHMRVLRRGDGSTPACLLRIPMGQFFGGRSVPMLGIAGVGVAPEARGGGLARRIMTDALREARGEGFAVSALYASTQRLYRKVGYEQAGFRFVHRLPVHRIDAPAGAAGLVPLEPAAWGVIKECGRAMAARFNGNLDRGDYIWRRVGKRRDTEYAPFGLVNASGGVDAYLFLHQERDAQTGRHDVLLSDCAWRTPEGARALLAFLGAFGTTANDVVMHAGPTHLLASLTGLQVTRTSLQELWMLRIIDVPLALSARGYPESLSVEFTIGVRDNDLPENDGVWAVRVRDGRAEVRPAPGPGPRHIAGCVRGLAMLYTGLATPAQAAGIGIIEGDAGSLEALDGVFHGGVPWMADFF
jgi:predicted acetyltransferase